ncbi:MAG: VPLPA-CTERM sorting domain-containing protein, partial [Gammaproteobacteria bacterium]|nr:VPLPA-CTERM sorting domain-containing protein [Gammaproteobacteria bacterium]
CIAPSPCSGTLNPLDPASWPLLDRTLTTYPYADPNDPNVPVAIELNNINVDGTMSVVAGTVTAAIINQLGGLSYGTFQTTGTISALVTGDTSINGCLRQTDPTTGLCTVTAGSAFGPLNALTWTYNSTTGQLNHQAPVGTGSLTNNNMVATCVNEVGNTSSGSCRQLRASVNADGELGGTTINNSVWNWNGMAANFIVRDSQTTPWHTGTGTTTTGGLQISGAGGHAGIVWDLSGFVDGVGGVITGRAVADALSGANATGMSGLYTLYLTPIPVPAAVWLFGGALGVLGFARRRQAAA